MSENVRIKLITIEMCICGDNKNMKIKRIEISGIGGISELAVDFKENVNIICGVNGIGKTTILKVITDAFLFRIRSLKRNSLYEKGKYKIYIEDEGKVKEIEVEVKASSPQEGDPANSNRIDPKNLMTFEASRDIFYTQLKNIPLDPVRDPLESEKILLFGIRAIDIKGWFVNRFLFSEQTKSKINTRNNFELSKKIFGLLDDDIKFNTVNPRTGDIILSSSKGDVYFEYMSSGYKTCFYILLGMIKEIEYRFGDSIFASDFSGIILIDEIDLHLHPLWQAKLINVLKNIFGNAQIIATTHSPSILQSLNKDEIIALGYDECGKAIVKELNLGEYGLQGWTLEEILQDVMEMPYTTSELYKRTISKFDKAMDDGNISEIKHNYEILDKMLHPRSTLRKLLQIQMAGLEE